MLKTQDFVSPSVHPYSMMAAFKNAAEKENFLAWMLFQNISAGDWGPIPCESDWDVLVKEGFLAKHGDRSYSLNRKAKGYLYAYYGNE